MLAEVLGVDLKWHLFGDERSMPADEAWWKGRESPKADRDGLAMRDRYTCPPLDPEGVIGPRDLSEMTTAQQHKLLNGPRYAGLPGYLTGGPGPWQVNKAGEWERTDREDEGD